MKILSIRRLLILTAYLWIMLSAAGCSIVPLPGTATPLPAGEENSQPSTIGEVAAAVEGVVTVVAQRTPVPTATPGPIEKVIERATTESGLAERSLLGIPVDYWINLLAAILFVVLGYFLGVWLLLGLLRWVVRRTAGALDDNILKRIERPLKWLVLIVVGRNAVLRLDFWNEGQIVLLDDLFFLLWTITLTIIALRMFSQIADWVLERRVPEANRKQLQSLIGIIKWLGYLFVVFFALSFMLNHFGVDISLIAAVILFAGLLVIIVGYSAKGAIGDVISGLLILTDQPFLVGDDLDIAELDIWGEVTAIGLRTTRIQTINNREVIVPNSLIAANQIVNYTRPVPELRVKTELSVAYGTDIEETREIIATAVRGVAGVMADKPVRVYYWAYDEAARKIRVYWYVGSIRDMEPVRDQVNSAVELALGEAGFEIPFPSVNFLLKRDAGDWL